MNLRNTMFVREVVYRPASSIVARAIVNCSDSEVLRWMQALTGTYPVATYMGICLLREEDKRALFGCGQLFARHEIESNLKL